MMNQRRLNKKLRSLNDEIDFYIVPSRYSPKFRELKRAFKVKAHMINMPYVSKNDEYHAYYSLRPVIRV